MLTLRCTAALLKKWRKSPDPSPPASDTVTGDWFGNVFELGGQEYFIFVSAETLISVITRATDDFPPSDFIPELHQALLDSDIPEVVVKAELERFSPVAFAKTDDNRVLGSMRAMVRRIDGLCARHDEPLDPASPTVRESLWYTSTRHGAPIDVIRDVLSEERPAPATKPGSAADTRSVVRALLQRAEAENTPSEVTLRRAMEISRDVGADLAWLMIHDQDWRLAKGIARLFSDAVRKNHVASAVLSRLCLSAYPVLEKAKRSKKHSPSVMVLVLMTLNDLYHGGDPARRRAYLLAVKSREEEQNREIDALTADPASISAFMKDNGLLSEFEVPAHTEELNWTFRLKAVERLMDKAPDMAGLLLCAGCAASISRNVEVHDVLLPAIRAFARLDAPGAMWQLRQLAHWPFAGAMGAAAEETCRQMQARGVRPRLSFAPKYRMGRVTSNDGAGERQMGLFFENDQGSRDALVLLSKDTWGLKTAFAQFGDDRETFALFSHQPRAVSVAPCDLAMSRALFGDAAALSLETGKRLPQEAFLCRQYLGEELIPLVRREPDLSAYSMDELARRPAQIKDSAKLAESPLYGGLWFAHPAAYLYLRNYTGNQRPGGGGIKAYIRDVCAKEKPRLMRRIAVIMEVEALAGRAEHRVNRMAARVLAALRGRSVAFADIPYIRELAGRSVVAITENLAIGYRDQEEASANAPPGVYHDMPPDYDW